jgi:hypothetical protein
MKDQLQFFAPWLVAPDEDGRPPGQTGPRAAFFQCATRTAVLLGTFMVLNGFLERVFRLPEQSYHGGWLLRACAGHRPTLLIAGMILGVLLLIFIPRMRRGWSQFAGGKSLRWFVGGLVLVLGWAGAGQAYNSWFDQGYLADRALLVVLAALVFWRPLFVFPFVALFWLMIWQLNYPSLGFGIQLAEFRPVANVLVLFSAALLIHAVLGGRHLSGFLFLTLCLVAANLWMPAWGKLRIGWITHGHLNYLLPNAYTHGWLSFLETGTIESIARSLAIFDWPMRICTLVLEVLAIVFLLRARSARWLLVLFTLLLGTFFMTIGYLFWKWMILHAAIWFLLFRKGGEIQATWRRQVFTRQHFAISLVVIAGSGLWFAPARLAWFDTPLTNTIRYEAIGDSGASYDLPARFFAPYDNHMRMSSFTPALTPGPTLACCYGVTGDRRLADKLVETRTPDDVIRLEDTYPGDQQPDEPFNRRFDEFVLRTAEVSNRSLADQRDRFPPVFLRPLPFLWTFPRGNPYLDKEPIRSVRIHRVSSFFDGQHYTVFRKDLLRTISIAR